MAFEELLNWSTQDGPPLWQRGALRRGALSGELTDDDLADLKRLLEKPGAGFQITMGLGQLQPHPHRPDVFGLERPILANDPAWVPGWTHWGMAGATGVCMMDPPFHPALLHRHPHDDKTSYHMMLSFFRGQQ